MACQPISLSDSQLALVLDAAKALPPGDARTRFLNNVADRLTAVEISDGSVEAAVEAAVERLLPPAA